MASKIGRNEPCPCGSGRKYKHCCLRREIEGKFEAIGRERAWDTMMDKLLDFSREPRFQRELVMAFDLFWNKTYDIDQVGSLEPAQVMNFLDWYAHDYRTAVDGRRIVEIFLEQRGETLSAHEREALRADSEALSSAFEVTGVEEGRSVHLLDIFRAEEFEVRHTPALHVLEAGHVLLARMAEWEGSHRFSWINALVPPEVQDDLKAYMQDMFARYQEEHYQASWAQLLRERSYLFNHFMLRLKGELPQPRILLPYQETAEAEPRPIVLTPGQVEPGESPSVLVPGRREERRRSPVIVPGQGR
ncbi:MAG TPA: SEC-C domain-containing protein [Anaerolineae bacterium]|nr:SEC-C domain-containing protein [Anaerolineae bacterium]